MIRKIRTRKGNELNAKHLKLRILNSIDKDYSTGCWVWARTLNNKGYGTMTINHKTVLVHRVSFGLFNRKLIGKEHVLHHCDNPKCCNPKHLFAGTHRENMIDAINKGRLFKLPPAHFVGSLNPMSKLNEQDILDIRKRLANGEFQKKVAVDYGVSQSLISLISMGKLWGHLQSGRVI